MEKELTAERSIEIIRETIEKSRRDVERQAGTPLIVWGSLVAFTAVIIGHLWEHCGGPVWNFLWFIMTAIGFALNRFIGQKPAIRPVSFVSKVVHWIWLLFCIITIVIAVLFYIVMLNPDIYRVRYIPLTPIIIILMMLCSSIMGLVVGNKLIPGMAFGSGICAVNFCLMWPGSHEMLMLAIVAIATLVIPGVIINSKAHS